LELKMRDTKKTFMLVSVGALALALTPPASATVDGELTLSDGIAADTIVVSASNCGTSGCFATYDGSVGNWDINVTTGISAPGQSPVLDLNSIDNRDASTAGETLTITWSADDFTPLPSGGTGFTLSVGGTVGANGTVTESIYGASSNNLLDESQQIGSTLSFSDPPAVAFSGSTTAYPASVTNPFSLTEVTTITFGAHAGQASFDASIDEVPEPAAAVLLGSAMLFIVMAVRKKVGKRA
jgi:hypothetical protein